MCRCPTTQMARHITKDVGPYQVFFCHHCLPALPVSNKCFSPSRINTLRVTPEINISLLCTNSIVSLCRDKEMRLCFYCWFFTISNNLHHRWQCQLPLITTKWFQRHSASGISILLGVRSRIIKSFFGAIIYFTVLGNKLRNQGQERCVWSWNGCSVVYRVEH